MLHKLLRAFVRIDKQAEHEEHDDLEKPGESVHEGSNLFSKHDLIITYHYTGNVYCQITVSM